MGKSGVAKNQISRQKPANEMRIVPLQIRLTENEDRILRAESKRLGRSISWICREAIFNSIKNLRRSGDGN